MPQFLRDTPIVGGAYSGHGAVPAGGTTAQRLGKASGADYDLAWIDAAAAGNTGYSATVGNGTATDIAVVHNLGTRDVLVSLVGAATPFDFGGVVSWTATDVDTVTLHFTTPPTTDQYRVTVLALGGTAGGGGGGGGAPTTSSYILQAADPALPNAQALAALATGLLTVATGTGVLGTAAAGTDYLAPTGSGAGLTNLNAASLATGTAPPARLGTGTPGTANFLRGDGTYASGLTGGLTLGTVAGANSPVGVLAVVNTTTVTANANATTAQNLMGYAVPAATLNAAGKTLQVFGAGLATINTTATVTIAIKLGTVTLASWTAASITATVASLPWNFQATLTTALAGATGTIEAHGLLTLKGSAGGGAATGYIDGNTTVSAAVDLTVAQTLQVTVTFSANGAGGNANNASQRLLTVELAN
jgi:hypothetical protein